MPIDLETIGDSLMKVLPDLLPKLASHIKFGKPSAKEIALHSPHQVPIT